MAATIILHEAFLRSAHELPKNIAKKLWKALDLFIHNPRHPSLNVEQLSGKARGLQSMRVDQQYRIIFRPEQQSPVLLVVGTHDDAYRIAERMATAELELSSSKDEIKGRRDEAMGVPGVLYDRVIAYMGLALVPGDALLSGRISPPVAPEVAEGLLRTRKYLPLALWLMQVGEGRNSIPQTFARIEEILGFSLPSSAHDYPAWWANDTSHSQASAWLAMGWKTVNVDVKHGSVTFAKRGAAQVACQS